MMKTITIDHLARVEGHGGITVNFDGNSIRDVQFDIFEGARLIEALVVGRSFQDVPQIVSRICYTAARILRATHCIFSSWRCRITWITRALYLLHLKSRKP